MYRFQSQQPPFKLQLNLVVCATLIYCAVPAYQGLLAFIFGDCSAFLHLNFCKVFCILIYDGAIIDTRILS
ncbi:hypothetical protein AX774_g607 [Zancudomyces culisetae]|uniref:Uncharacterized protein n=1 Tax=Zancudomyces culisetae TaxID=1213189 RepID=A0A1R1PXY4_ZANCU|nr:hypothetical protein AX774_g607 [Zancudomyces culisetae]|eukprot:OMH85831.1 hypothetical protein AX774_g607 [Zancudomyces culisetae]